MRTAGRAGNPRRRLFTPQDDPARTDFSGDRTPLHRRTIDLAPPRRASCPETPSCKMFTVDGAADERDTFVGCSVLRGGPPRRTGEIDGSCSTSSALSGWWLATASFAESSSI